MILSEFAGAAQSLNGSLVVNPWDSQAVADAIHEAVTMDPEVKKANQQKLSKVSVPCVLDHYSHLELFSTSENTQLHTGVRRS